MPGALDGDRQFPLLACRTMGLAAWQYFASLVETHFKTLDVLVIDHLVVGKNWLLAATSSPAPTWAARFPTIT